ncbi:deoxyribose-phosphate aldolase [Halomonas piscis]|uniref:Deoxyribose-phosphate aldolase n=1 Tax=Halomonas piscis TaxID=3031727 RepID=A0ABY9YX40_9GAMM|nr:deoxyribose-phosphate aldolase [Halomonas piscis]WNK19449.1 deoxyribose-phosphate aldolase [Halomonas piscis]
MPASINLLQAARQALPLLDVTRLDTADRDADIESLCQQAKTPFGHPAAVCVYPQFVVAARRALTAHTLSGEVRIAAVANFPEGGDDIMAAARETREAVASGADEVDVVLPWRALLDGDEDTCLEFVEMCKAACGGQALLKVILEAGELEDPAQIRRASELAIEGGADFLKTATGRAATGATPEAATVMLEAIRESGEDVGFKAAGGVDTAEDAATYLSLVADIMGPAWIAPTHLRLGSTTLLPNLVATLAGSPDTA